MNFQGITFSPQIMKILQKKEEDTPFSFHTMIKCLLRIFTMKYLKILSRLFDLYLSGKH